MNARKASILSLMLVIILSVVGIVYAHWSDLVTIEGTINMGSLTLSFDWEEPPNCIEYWMNDTQLVEGEYLNKSVGDCSCWFEDVIQDPHTGKLGYKKLVILVNNAYPQYYVHTTFKLHNIGTIPLSLVAFNITGEKRNATGHKIYNLLWYDPNGDHIGSLWEDVNNNSIVDTDVDIEVINLEITNQLPYQIDPCHTHKCEIDLDFKQDAEECHTYFIYVEVISVQWNKASEVEG